MAGACVFNMHPSGDCPVTRYFSHLSAHLHCYTRPHVSGSSLTYYRYLPAASLADYRYTRTVHPFAADTTVV